MIESINIDNFRCFREFSLNTTSRINIISGKNNTGKTTLLESIFLLFSCHHPDMLIKTNLLRKTLLTSFPPDIVWEHFFYDRQMTNTILLSSKFAGDDIFLSICKGSGMVQPLSSLPINKDFRPRSDAYPLQLVFSYKEAKQTATIIPLMNGISTQWDKALPQHPLPEVYYSDIVEEQETLRRFGAVEKQGKKEYLVQLLKKLEPELEDISTIAEESPRLYAKKTGHPLLPLFVMGEGLSQLLRFITAILVHPNSIFLLDEVERGFHYSFMKDFWCILEEAAIESNVQIFATTHSLECIRAASEAIENRENIVYTRLGKGKDRQIKPYIFSGEELEYALEQDMEIR